MPWAGQDERALTLAGAARNEASLHAAAVFAAETLAISSSGAANHRARLALRSAVFEAVLRSVAWTGETSINLALSLSAMPEAEASASARLV